MEAYTLPLLVCVFVVDLVALSWIAVEAAIEWFERD